LPFIFVSETSMIPLPKLLSIVIASAAISACVQAPGPAPGPLLAAEGATARAAIVEPVRFKGKTLERRALVRTAARPADPALAPAQPQPEPVQRGEPVPATHTIAANSPQPEPSGTVGRILAGPVAGAYAATLPRASAGRGDARMAFAGAPASAPAGWKLVVCGFAILVFIALRRSRLLRG
jgi:hypothetical protein